MSKEIKDTYSLLMELLHNENMDRVISKLYIHKGTINRWLQLKKVPDNYYNDINHLLGDKYKSKDTYRQKDQFYTTGEIAKYCFDKTLEVLKQLNIKEQEYTFIEPSAGVGSFYNILPVNRRIGIDIEPKGNLSKELIKSNFLDYIPQQNKKYIVIGNPPFGLRGNLALRFISHSYNFADIVAFILPPLFNSTGKGVPMTRVKGYKLAYSKKLPLNSFEYPDGKKINVATIFQVWTKINLDKIKMEKKKECKSYMRVYSLSDGGTPSSTRNKKMIDKCDFYLPSTCFSGMKLYNKFRDLPNKRGYGVVFYKKRQQLSKIFLNTNWEKIAFLSTNNALNLRTDLIENTIINKGFCDK